MDRWQTRNEVQPPTIDEQEEQEEKAKTASSTSSSSNTKTTSTGSTGGRTSVGKVPVVKKHVIPPPSDSTNLLSTKKQSSRKGGSAAKISKNEIAVEVEKEEGEEEEDDEDDEPYSDQSSGISPYPSSDEFEDSETDSKKSQSSKSNSVVTPKTSGIRTSYKIKNPEIKVVTNNLKTLPNLKILERRPLDEWWEEYLTSKNAGSVQPRNSYFPPQMEMQIGILMFDEDQTDMEHWKKWDDDKWIKQIRERLPLTTQSTDHIMDCS
jgi:hypothetical protein